MSELKHRLVKYADFLRYGDMTKLRETEEALRAAARRIEALERAAEPLLVRLLAGDAVEGNPKSDAWQMVAVSDLRALAREVTGDLHD